MGVLILSRPNDYGGRFRQLLIRVDGSTVGGLKPSEEMTLSVEEGQHVLVGSMDWVRSPELFISIGKNPLRVEASLPLASVLKIFVLPRRAVLTRILD